MKVTPGGKFLIPLPLLDKHQFVVAAVERNFDRHLTQGPVIGTVVNAAPSYDISVTNGETPRAIWSMASRKHPTGNV